MEDNTLQAGTNAEIVTGEDLTTINRTIDDIEKIYDESRATIHESVGQLIMQNIFDNDYACAREINNQTPDKPRAKLFIQLIDELSRRSADKILPKKTFLYNCVNLILDKKLLEVSPEFEKYNALSISHKIELLSVKDVEDKVAHITNITDNNLSVRQTRDQIGKTTVKRSPALLAYIEDPSKIVKVDDIKLVGGKRRDVAIEKATDKIAAIKEQISNNEEDIKKLNALVKKLNNYTPVKGRKKKAK